MGKSDRMLRGVLGVVILGVGLAMGSWWGLIGLIPLATAFTGFCPAYVPFGWNTGKTEGE
jgi:hypothetical protein